MGLDSWWDAAAFAGRRHPRRSGWLHVGQVDPRRQATHRSRLDRHCIRTAARVDGRTQLAGKPYQSVSKVELKSSGSCGTVERCMTGTSIKSDHHAIHAKDALRRLERRYLFGFDERSALAPERAEVAFI